MGVRTLARAPAERTAIRSALIWALHATHAAIAIASRAAGIATGLRAAGATVAICVSPSMLVRAVTTSIPARALAVEQPRRGRDAPRRFQHRPGRTGAASVATMWHFVRLDHRGRERLAS